MNSSWFPEIPVEEQIVDTAGSVSAVIVNLTGETSTWQVRLRLCEASDAESGEVSITRNTGEPAKPVIMLVAAIL